MLALRYATAQIELLSPNVVIRLNFVVGCRDCSQALFGEAEVQDYPGVCDPVRQMTRFFIIVGDACIQNKRKQPDTMAKHHRTPRVFHITSLQRMLGVCRLYENRMKASRDRARGKWKLGPVRLFSAVEFSCTLVKNPRVTSAGHVGQSPKPEPLSARVTHIAYRPCWRDPFLRAWRPVQAPRKSQLPRSRSCALISGPPFRGDPRVSRLNAGSFTFISLAT